VEVEEVESFQSSGVWRLFFVKRITNLCVGRGEVLCSVCVCCGGVTHVVAGVELGAVLAQELDPLAPAVVRGVVQRRVARSVAAQEELEKSKL
jgi:hypothetical protein